MFCPAGLKRRAEETGAALAQYRYGRVLLEGRGGPTDREAARLWLEKAAAQTHVEASVLLARIYLSAPREIPSASPPARRGCSNLRRRGATVRRNIIWVCCIAVVLGVTAHPEEAFTWLLAASENGHIEAQFELSRAYARGKASRRMPNRRCAGCRKPLMQAMVRRSSFGLCAGPRTGVEQNRRAAVDWLLRSAETGFGQAQLALGRKYLTGDGVAARPAEAQRWLEAAAAQGSGGGHRAGDRLARRPWGSC
ncbi:tetratricopeptide repeat protein [Parasedimentitalea marina]|uniref:tetratricopeptide repeat protein n=1 Tax=Parasedimentitalea marina TaxID=2483033 RepID=UPI0013E406D5|nr:tetratricopeptide repeat protein [Parasedimentitalea marina]